MGFLIWVWLELSLEKVGVEVKILSFLSRIVIYYSIIIKKSFPLRHLHKPFMNSLAVAISFSMLVILLSVVIIPRKSVLSEGRLKILKVKENKSIGKKFY